MTTELIQNPPQTSAHSRPTRPTILPLENGERLTRSEFERRYAAMSRVKKAELIEGAVHIMPSALHHQAHGSPHGIMAGWLFVYVAATPGVEVSDNATVRLDADNEYQPDVLLRLKTGGRSRVSDDDYIEGAPELIIEIAASSASIDLHEKKRAYRRAGVQEYIVWEVYDEQIEWFILREGEYVLLKPDENGVCASEVFPGLRLAVTALLQGDLAAVMAEVQKGLASPEHTAFAASLAGQ